MALVTGAVGGLLPKLGELAKKEYGLQKGVKQKIEKLSRELEAAHAVLREISDVPPDQLNELVRIWARDLREASYDMEDIVDGFLVRVGAPAEPATETYKLLRRLRKKVTSLFKKTKACRNISSEIQEIYKKLEELTARRDRYKTADGFVTKQATTIDPRIPNLYKSARELVGIDGQKNKLTDMLSIGDNKKMKIVSIVGCGGLGKTTLAKVVYDGLNDGFECGAFVPVGRNPDIKKVLRDILIGLDKEKYMNWVNMMILDVNQLMDELKELIKGKRYLIVIDDIWDKDSWKLIRCALQESNCESRLVITTRVSEVAAYADEAYKIQPLSDDISKKLLYARIFDGEGKHLNSLSIEACERILKKCGGVPLAIITIASLLASKPGENWSEIYNSIGFGHEANDDVDNTRRILSFSYYDLPSHLKPCLLYLSLFPEDQVIEKNSLIWMWIAEGLISEDQAAAAGVGSFELGQSYFNELINRNMIQAQERGYEGYVNACSVHDMVLDLIHRLSSEENFVTVLYGGEQLKLQGSISRRLALQCVEEHNVGQLANIAVEKVRSIFVSRCEIVQLCPRLPFLRVVEMAGHSFWDQQGRNKDMLDHLRTLLHLRYLGLESLHITKLPREVRYLRFLQTLDVRYSYIEELPEEVGLLRQLVCLRAGNCTSETRVPTGMIGKLKSLQELCICCAGEDTTMQFLKELGLLKELRVLKTSIHIGISESMASALLESLGHLDKIQELEILYYYYVPGKYSDAGWNSCCHLRFLHLECLVFFRLPAWINSSLAPNIIYLNIRVVAVKDQDMETLAKLPELSCLILWSESDDLVSIKIGTDEGVIYFPKLRFLRILGQSIWFDLCGSNSSRVTSSNTIMPSLESLEFGVHVRSLRDENLQLSFDKMLVFQNLGTSSLQRVTAAVNCKGARMWEVEEAEAALEHAATIHPNHHTLESGRFGELYMMSLYQERLHEWSAECACKLADIVGSGHIQILRMPDPEASSSKVIRLLYTDNGMALVALSSDAVHRVWKWEHDDMYPRGQQKWEHNDKYPRVQQSSKSVPPVFWQPENGILMKNDTTDGNNPEEATACTAISKFGRYYRIVSASGGKVLMFDMDSFMVMGTFMAPPPAATFLAFHPLNNDILAIGMEDSSIQILHVSVGKVQNVLTGHQKKITGLVFSKWKKVLVSSCADAQLCVWSIDDWGKKKSRYLQPPSDLSDALVGDTMVQFHCVGTRLLVVHESQLAIYDWQLECLCSWFPRDTLPTPISSAVYSLGCLLVYAGFRDGAIGIFEAESLTLQCRIAPSAYIPSSISSSETVYPTALAAHPCWKANEITVGMSDGAVLVLEPLNTNDVQVGSNADTEQYPPSDVSNRGGHSQV